MYNYNIYIDKLKKQTQITPLKHLQYLDIYKDLINSHFKSSHIFFQIISC